MTRKKTATQVRWKQLLFEADELKGQAGGIVYDRTMILLKVFNDAEFRNDNGVTDDQKAASILDSKVSELFIRFWDLKAIHEMFPDRDQWVQGDLREMHAEVLDEHNKATEDLQLPRPKRESVKVADFKELERKAESREARANALAAEVEQKQEIITTTERREQAALAREKATLMDFANVEDDLTKANRRVAQLESENDQLRAELEQANARISELESMVTTEPATA